MTTGQSSGGSNESSSVSPAARRQALLNERLMQSLDELMQQLRSEHESDWRQQFSDALSTTETVINDQTQWLTAQISEALSQVESRQTRRISGWETALSDSETRQRQQIEEIEQRLATAATQAERLSQVGGLRSWTRPLAITAAVMLAIGGTTAGGLLLTDRLIDSRLERLATLQEEIQRAEQVPRLPQGVEIREIQGGTYLVGIDPDEAWVGNLRDGTPVIELTNTRD